ncbi:hypothetical protein [Streptomyces sp. NPDC090112]|uniref:hypothetical protein n=2 Tax=Streptomyces TaxID=1883 RepID=UPI003807B21C
MAMGRARVGKTTREAGAEPEEKKLDLSVAQVAGTSLATVAAALLASKMGVYGTILGAGVVSVVATAGGPVIQHLFRRTGDQLRGSAVPRPRQVPPSDGGPATSAAAPAVAPGEFGAATVHGTRMRGWKRTAVASGAAFALAIGGLGTYEAVAGTSVSSGGGTLFSVGTRTAGPDRPAPPADAPDTTEDGRGKDRQGDGRGRSGESPGPRNSPDPSRSQGDRSPSADPTPSGSGGPAPDASPSARPSAPSPAPSGGSPGPGASSPAPGPS